MNKISIIRKGAIKDYLVYGFSGGFILGVLAFLLSLIHSSFEESLLVGLLVWVGIIILFIGVGFTTVEYIFRKLEIRRYNSNKYAFLDLNYFRLGNDLIFEGEYEGFCFRVIPISKWQKNGNGSDYDIIMAYYNFHSDSLENRKEHSLCGEYFLGSLDFHDNCLGFVPKNWESPDFKSIFDGVINIFKREKLLPISKKDWEDSFGEKWNNTFRERSAAKSKW